MSLPDMKALGRRVTKVLTTPIPIIVATTMALAHYVIMAIVSGPWLLPMP